MLHSPRRGTRLASPHPPRQVSRPPLSITTPALATTITGAHALDTGVSSPAHITHTHSTHYTHNTCQQLTPLYKYQHTNTKTTDVPLIEGLEATKAAATEITAAVSEGKRTEQMINQAREMYRPQVVDLNC